MKGFFYGKAGDTYNKHGALNSQRWFHYIHHYTGNILLGTGVLIIHLEQMLGQLINCPGQILQVKRWPCGHPQKKKSYSFCGQMLLDDHLPYWCHPGKVLDLS